MNKNKIETKNYRTKKSYNLKHKIAIITAIAMMANFSLNAENIKNNTKDNDWKKTEQQTKTTNKNNTNKINIWDIKNNIKNFQYLNELKNLDSNINIWKFKETRKKIEKNIPTDSLSDAEVRNIFLWLYDLKTKFKNSKDNEKIIKKINKLMWKYDPLFWKYEWFDNVRDRLLNMIEDQITDDEYNTIETFFTNEWEIKSLYNNKKNKKYANWSELNNENEIWWEWKLQKMILKWIENLIKQWAINKQELIDFKTVMSTRGMMSTDLDKLQINN